MAKTEPRRKLKILVTIPRSGEVREFIRLLSDLEYVYNHLYAWNLIVEQAKADFPDPSTYWRRRPRRGLRQISKPDQVVLPEDRLYLSKIEIASPGWVEIIGALNPLETIRKYLQDRHVRRQDRQYREPAEAGKLALENQHRRLEIVKEEVDLLQRLGFPGDRIRATLSKHFFDPSERLDRIQDCGLIESARVVGEDDTSQVTKS